MLAFLHTAAVHVPTFARLARELDAELTVRHAVREDLLAQALADGQVTEATRRNTAAEVERLVADGARVVLCTCSTLGRAAEETVAPPARVLRVDRPMAEHAARLGRPILLVAATPTAMATTAALLREANAPPFRELLCSDAWSSFEAGDHAGYAAAIAAEAGARARPHEVIVLGQASMGSAASLIRRTDVEVLTSPPLAVRAAVALLRATD